MGLLTDLLGDGASGTLGAMAQKFTTAKWYAALGGRSTISHNLNRMTYMPIWLPASSSVDRLGVEVTTVGAAGSVIRVGMYDDDGGGRPGALLVDAGTVDATTTGAKELTVTQDLASGGVYWLAAVAQVATATLRSATGPLLPVGTDTLAAATAATPPVGFYENSISGALPASATPVTTTTAGYLVGVRAGN